MREIANGFVDRFAHQGRADIVRAFTYPFPMEVIAEILASRPRIWTGSSAGPTT